MAMLQKLDEAEKNSDIKSIQLKTGRTVRSVLLRDISYVEAMQHNVIYHLTDGNEVEVYATFTDAVKEISADSRFIRCHRSHLVNMDEITAITGNEITLRDKKVLSISRPYADVKRRYYDRGLTKQSV